MENIQYRFKSFFSNEEYAATNSKLLYITYLSQWLFDLEASKGHQLA